MRFVLKIAAIFVSLIISIILAFFRFLTMLSGAVLSIAAVLLFLIGIFSIFIFGFRDALGCLIFAFLISPMGIPWLAGWLLDKLADVNFTLRSFIVG